MLVAASLALALAGPPAPAIEWSAPPGCPTRAQVLDRTARIMGRPALDELPTAVSIRGRIEAEPVGFALAIELETPTGRTRKQARAAECSVLGNVAALMVAVAIDPVQAVTTLASEPPTNEAPPSVPNPQPTAVSEPNTTPEPRASPQPRATAERLESRRNESTDADGRTMPRDRWIQALLRASGGIGAGLVPGFDGQLSLGAGVRTRRLRAELLAFHVLARDARYPALPTVGAAVAAWGGSLRAGPVFERGTVELSTSAGVSAAALVATGFGVLSPDTAASAWVALCFVPGVRWRPVPRLAVGADVEGEVALRRPAFALDALPTVHRAGPIGVRGAVVVEVRLGSRAR